MLNLRGCFGLKNLKLNDSLRGSEKLSVLVFRYCMGPTICMAGNVMGITGGKMRNSHQPK